MTPRIRTFVAGVCVGILGTCLWVAYEATGRLW